jgi:acyl-CoA thioesterase I
MFVALMSITCVAQAENAGWDLSKGKAGKGDPYKLLFFGDSILSGYGLGDSQGAVTNVIITTFERNNYVDRGIAYKDLSHPGETTSGSVTRIKQAIALRPDVIVFAIGTNDALNNVDPDVIYNNLDIILKDLTRSGIYTLFVGMQATTRNGYDYLSKFNSVYAKLAQKYPVVFMPYLQEGVAGNRLLNQRDGIHPNAEGAKVIAANMGDILKRMMKQVGGYRRQLKNEEYHREYVRKQNEQRAKRGLSPLEP